MTDNISLLKLGRGKKWKLVDSLSEYDEIVMVEKKEFGDYVVINNEKLGNYITVDDLLNYARCFGYKQVKITFVVIQKFKCPKCDEITEIECRGNSRVNMILCDKDGNKMEEITK